jgi:hypothetical protein
MDARHERIAKNEAMYRAVNRELEEASEDAGGGAGPRLEILCKCGEPGCNTMLTLAIGEYDEAHGQPDRFIVAVEHADQLPRSNLHSLANQQVRGEQHVRSFGSRVRRLGLRRLRLPPMHLSSWRPATRQRCEQPTQQVEHAPTH